MAKVKEYKFRELDPEYQKAIKKGKQFLKEQKLLPKVPIKYLSSVKGGEKGLYDRKNKIIKLKYLSRGEAAVDALAFEPDFNLRVPSEMELLELGCLGIYDWECLKRDYALDGGSEWPGSKKQKFLKLVKELIEPEEIKDYYTKFCNRMEKSLIHESIHPIFDNSKCINSPVDLNIIEESVANGIVEWLEGERWDRYPGPYTEKGLSMREKMAGYIDDVKIVDNIVLIHKCLAAGVDFHKIIDIGLNARSAEDFKSSLQVLSEKSKARR